VPNREERDANCLKNANKNQDSKVRQHTPVFVFPGGVIKLEIQVRRGWFIQRKDRLGDDVAL
jgi:hypothetical protein